MLKRQRAKKATAKEKARIGRDGSKYLNCKVCEVIEVKTSYDTVAVTCRYCVARSVAAPEMPKSMQKSGKPQGWHFKSYFEHEGKVYSRGVEITDPTELKELKLKNKPSKSKKSSDSKPKSKKAAVKKVAKKTTSKKSVKPSVRGNARANTTR